MIFKLFVICCGLAAVVLASETYTDKYDNMNVDEILESKRLLKAYVDCLLDRGKCTPEGKALREKIEDALRTGCDKCTETQKTKTTKVIDYMIKNELDYWKELCAKYDPDGVWRKKYEEQAKERGIVIPA